METFPAVLITLNEDCVMVFNVYRATNALRIFTLLTA